MLGEAKGLKFGPPNKQRDVKAKFEIGTALSDADT